MMYQSIIENLQDALGRILDAVDMQIIASHCEQIGKPAKSIDALGNRIALALPVIRRAISGQPCTGATLPHPSTDTPQPISHWKTTEATQILLLACAIQSHDEWPPQQIIDIAYRYGDDTERCSLLKGLYWLDLSADMVFFAVDAGRTNSTELLASLALANPYPGQHYNEAQYNQLMLKALFMGLDISTAIGLQARTNCELTRMCSDYIAERLAAEREAPASIWLATNPIDLDPEMLNIFIAHLCNNDPAQRFYTAMSLAWRDNLSDKLVQAIAERLQIESNERIRKLLNTHRQTDENNET